MYRFNNSWPADNPETPWAEYVLPIVVVKDPYFWMQSMCKSSYEARWATRLSCPELILQRNNGGIPVSIVMDQTHDTVTEHYDSLPGFWSTWYRYYLEDDRPRIFVRYEDLLFHAKSVLEQIVDCIGVDMPENVQYFTDKAKKHGNSRGFVDAIQRYGSPQARLEHLNAPNIELTRKSLDDELMRLLHYSYG